MCRIEPLYHCRFDADGARRIVRYERSRARSRGVEKHLFAICSVDDSSCPERIISAVLVRTDADVNAPEFIEAVVKLFRSSDALRGSMQSETYFEVIPIASKSSRVPSPVSSKVLFERIPEFLREEMSRPDLSR